VWRVARGRRLDRNTLRRPSDRAETVIMAGMLVAALAGAPFAALAGGGVAHDLAVHHQQAELASQRQLTAVTTQAAPVRDRTDFLTNDLVPARWTLPNGGSGYGEVPVAFGSPAGTSTLVWSTLDGKQAAPPISTAQVADLTTLGQATGAVAVLVAALLAWGLARHELDRRRLAAWDAEWRATDSPGTGYLHG
jgi:hypothetical protein